METRSFDVIIIGGSYAGLSAAMALGRALRKILIIDSGLPCNRQTPHSHNFITQDGETPAIIAEKARAQVRNYNTVEFISDLVIEGYKTDDGFGIKTQTGAGFIARKLIFATGLKDLMPDLNGFAECWGISVIHCPYCHGYEVKNEKTGILANGNFAFHYGRLISNWTKDLTIFTNGKSTLAQQDIEKLAEHNIAVIEKEIESLRHKNGHIEEILFKDNTSFVISAIYSRPNFEQHCKVPENLGCEMTEQGLLKVDMFHETTVKGVFACGDMSSMMRSVANAVASGNFAGAKINSDLIEEQF